ncbi:hypothetical protein CB0940_08601 [Cercospora beticola]|uniref:Lipocalin-like domain-containing protein n=1 Tax=Cercospora beticola TaxID=122368 RepID=A0A2G5HR54_CERBT|nr:hypothetical protein CB0940_08601 [Cercospora beticola]PIA94702.1 hypothetical protein CB0940_08601 [Cercospora beticola]WPB05178.1 hypothetical protein RHO25_009828 [Cercospora beticola]CAK1364965.1 unnamed protein product [Cercospora beticola]
MVNSQTILKALAGTYALVNTTTLYNGVPGKDTEFGANPAGQLIYTKSGYVSVVITDAANTTLSFAGPFYIDTDVPSNKTAGQLFYGPIVASDYPDLIGSREHTKYDVVISDGRIGFPHGTRILSTQSLGHNGTEELAVWRSID